MNEQTDTNIVISLATHTESVVLQYLIAATAVIHTMSGNIDMHTPLHRETAKDDSDQIPEREYEYEIMHNGRKEQIHLIVQKNAPLQLKGSIEALEILVRKLLEIQKPHTKNIDEQSVKTEMDVAPEELYPLLTPANQADDLEIFYFFLWYALTVVLMRDIEQLPILCTYT